MQKIDPIFISKIAVWGICIFQLSSCAIVEKTRRHLLGDARSSQKENSQIQNKEPVQENQQPVQIGAPSEANNTVSLDNSSSVAIGAVPELADPNSIWVFDNRVGDESANSDLDILKTALDLYSKKQWDASMGQLRSIVQSTNDQVQVRARFYAGKILQYKNKHSLALQVFEQLIEQNGYSSLALLSVKEASHSAKIAQLKDKEIFYQSSLEELSKQGNIP
jgi:hypothetical protein